MSASSAAIRTVLVGVTGRMGRQLLRQWSAHPQLQLIGAVASDHSPSLGQDAGVLAGLPDCGVKVSASLAPLLQRAQLVIDFSSAAAADAHLTACVNARVPLLVGTTGLAPGFDSKADEAARQIALLVAPNTSVGVNLLMELVRQAAQALGTDYDIEIAETHHRHKADAPSGTALALGRTAAAARGMSLETAAVFSRHGQTGERRAGQIGFTVQRGGDVVGEHTVAFLGEGESVSLSHRASDRAVFARGALIAAAWLAHQAPGRYAMRDVFFSKNS